MVVCRSLTAFLTALFTPDDTESPATEEVKQAEHRCAQRLSCIGVLARSPGNRRWLEQHGLVKELSHLVDLLLSAGPEVDRLRLLASVAEAISPMFDQSQGFEGKEVMSRSKVSVETQQHLVQGGSLKLLLKLYRGATTTLTSPPSAGPNIRVTGISSVIGFDGLVLQGKVLRTLFFALLGSPVVADAFHASDGVSILAGSGAFLAETEPCKE